MVEQYANSGDPDQMSCFVASDLGLHCLPITLLGCPDYNWIINMLLIALEEDGHPDVFFCFFLSHLLIWPK